MNNVDSLIDDSRCYKVINNKACKKERVMLKYEAM